MAGRHTQVTGSSEGPWSSLEALLCELSWEHSSRNIVFLQLIQRVKDDIGTVAKGSLT